MEKEDLVEHRKLEITLNSARNLPNVRSYLQMKVYATVRIGDIIDTTTKTPTDRNGGTNPVWNYSREYLIPETNVQQAADLKVIIEFYCERSLKKDKYIGQVSILINELFNTRNDGTTKRIFRLDEGNGEVNLSYNFGDVVNGARIGGPEDRPDGRRWRRYIEPAARLGRRGASVLLETAISTAAGIFLLGDRDG